MNTGQTILYAEDDENDAYLMKRAFRLAAVPNPLCIVPDGQQAIEYLSREGGSANGQPCLVLLDLKLPMVSGIEVLTWARAKMGASIPIAVLTSSNQPRDIDQSYQAGANAFLIKPSNPEELQAMVKGMRSLWLSVR